MTVETASQLKEIESLQLLCDCDRQCRQRLQQVEARQGAVAGVHHLLHQNAAANNNILADVNEALENAEGDDEFVEDVLANMQEAFNNQGDENPDGDGDGDE
jgi:hypothetical protein